jgi:hypothetical protein
MERDADCFSDGAFVATGALPIIQQSTTTRLQIPCWNDSEASCALNARAEITLFLFMMGWRHCLLWDFLARAWLRLSTFGAKFNNQQ